MTIEQVEIDGATISYEILPLSTNFSLEELDTTFSGKLAAVAVNSNINKVVDFNLLSKAIKTANESNTVDAVIQVMEESPYVYCPSSVRDSVQVLINELKLSNQNFLAAGLANPKVQLRLLINFLQQSSPAALGGGHLFHKDLCLISIKDGQLNINEIY